MYVSLINDLGFREYIFDQGIRSQIGLSVEINSKTVKFED